MSHALLHPCTSSHLKMSASVTGSRGVPRARGATGNSAAGISSWCLTRSMLTAPVGQWRMYK